MRYAISLCVMAMILATGCGRKQVEQGASADSAAPTVNAGFDYACTDGVKFNARIDRGNVILTVDGQEHTLPPDVNTSGAHFSGDNMTFIAQGKEATLIRGGESARSCQTP